MSEDAPIVDVAAVVDRVMGELATAGYEDEDGRGDQDGRLDVHRGRCAT